MFKKSFVAVMSALAITTTGMTSTASTIFANASEGNDNSVTSVSLFSYSPNTLDTSFSYTEGNITKIRKLPVRTACVFAGVSMNSDYVPQYTSNMDIYNYNQIMGKIQDKHETLSCKSEWRYSQTGNSYGYTNPTYSCPTYALATALSIYKGQTITPDRISSNSTTDGTGTKWLAHNSIAITTDVPYCSDLTESEILLAIDTQLAQGRPALIKVTRNSDCLDHWATVIRKTSTTGNVGNRYTVIDPYYGNQCTLSNMVCYKDGAAITGYAILTDEISDVILNM